MSDSEFDRDFEGQNFYLLDTNASHIDSEGKLAYIQIQPSSKTHMHKIKTIE